LDNQPDRPYPRSWRDGGVKYHMITTGPVKPGTLKTGGLYKRHLNEPILDFVQVDDIGAVLSNVEELGGTITMSKTTIPGVGHTAMILYSEGNLIGLLMLVKS